MTFLEAWIGAVWGLCWCNWCISAFHIASRPNHSKLLLAHLFEAIHSVCQGKRCAVLLADSARNYMRTLPASRADSLRSGNTLSSRVYVHALAPLGKFMDDGCLALKRWHLAACSSKLNHQQSAKQTIQRSDYTGWMQETGFDMAKMSLGTDWGWCNYECQPFDRFSFAVMKLKWGGKMSGCRRDIELKPVSDPVHFQSKQRVVEFTRIVVTRRDGYHEATRTAAVNEKGAYDKLFHIWTAFLAALTLLQWDQVDSASDRIFKTWEWLKGGSKHGTPRTIQKRIVFSLPYVIRYPTLEIADNTNCFTEDSEHNGYTSGCVAWAVSMVSIFCSLNKVNRPIHPISTLRQFFLENGQKKAWSSPPGTWNCATQEVSV